MSVSPLALVAAAVVVWLLIGVASLARPRSLRVVRMAFTAGAAVGAAMTVIALIALSATPHALTLPLGLPDLPFHLRIDALSASFLALLGSAGAAISLYASGYFRGEETTAPGLISFQYHVFVAAMALVLVADDAYVFMVAWETMALASYFLVTTDHRVPDVRRAGFLYLLIAHVGALGILLCFGALQGGRGDYTFDAMRAGELAGAWPSVAFVLALFGFGAKAGLLPLHAWLPEAHPAAPSPVSALMSGVMLKMAIYGLLRVAFDFLHAQLWWWGAVALALGLATALFGVIFAAAQTDMKRLLAYSSIENIGIVVAGVGLAILFRAYAQPALAALAMTAALYHCINHAFFKSLLFLATGSVLHATHERSLGKLGGLIHRMPWVAWLALVGTVAMAGLPPLNGFVSEWLLLQAFLFTPTLPQSFVNMLVPVAAAALVLTVALAAYVMVKFFGVIFLGRPREPYAAHVQDAGPRERVALAGLAAGCLLLGILPSTVIGALDHVNAQLFPAATRATGPSTWLVLAPIATDRSSYSPLIMLAVIVAVVLLTVTVMRRLWHGRTRRAPAWDCGFPLQTPRMQDTAEGFGQPIRQVFEPFFRMERHLPTPFDASPRYAVSATDRLWHWLYVPIARASEAVGRFAGLIQRGRIAIYLTYSFVTLLALLLLVR